MLKFIQHTYVSQTNANVDVIFFKDVYEAEERDNQSEQKKHTGSPLFYGQIIEVYSPVILFILLYQYFVLNIRSYC